jgi:hypothetical protein
VTIREILLAMVDTEFGLGQKLVLMELLLLFVSGAGAGEIRRDDVT